MNSGGEKRKRGQGPWDGHGICQCRQVSAEPTHPLSDLHIILESSTVLGVQRLPPRFLLMPSDSRLPLPPGFFPQTTSTTCSPCSVCVDKLMKRTHKGFRHTVGLPEEDLLGQQLSMALEAWKFFRGLSLLTFHPRPTPSCHPGIHCHPFSFSEANSQLFTLPKKAISSPPLTPGPWLAPGHLPPNTHHVGFQRKNSLLIPVI